MADTPDQQTPQINMDALKQTMTEVVRGEINSIRQQEQQRQAQQVQQQQRQNAQQQWAADPVAQTLQPYLAPVVQQLTMQNAAANDKADFYISNPDAVEFRADIENAFNRLMEQGRALDRATIYSWYIGEKTKANPNWLNERRQAQLQQTQRQGVTVGGAPAGRPDASVMDDAAFRALPLDQKREKLANMSF